MAMIFETDKLGLRSDPYLTTNIGGVVVEVRRVDDKYHRPWFCAYANLKHSKHLCDEYLYYPTFREDDWVGVDTMHSHNQEQGEAQRLADSISQIGLIIGAWKTAVGDRS